MAASRRPSRTLVPRPPKAFTSVSAPRCASSLPRQEALQDRRFVLVRGLVTAGSVCRAETKRAAAGVGALCHRGCREEPLTTSPATI